MPRIKIFNIIKAERFFSEYAPEVKTWRNKLSGKNNGRPADFTLSDKLEINSGLEKLIKDLRAQKFK